MLIFLSSSLGVSILQEQQARWQEGGTWGEGGAANGGRHHKQQQKQDQSQGSRR